MTSIIVTGFPKHAPYLARILNEHARGVRAVCYSDSRIDVIAGCVHALHADASISIGGPRPKEIVQRICEVRRRPVILYWAGSDVLTLAQHPAELERLRLARIVHWTCAPHLVAELADLGIEARYVPLASASVPSTLTPLPSRFTVLAYLPEPRRKFYGEAYVWEAAETLRDVRFIVVGEGKPDPGAPPNVEYVGEVDDIDARIDASSVLLRLPQHDGLSRNVVEALARGRHVIWTHSLPGVIQVGSHTEAVDAIGKLRDAHRAGELTLNLTGSRHVAAHHVPRDIASGVMSALSDAFEVVQSAALRDEGKGRCRLAISGHDLFSARVAANCQRYSERITGSVLDSCKTTETALSLLDLLASDIWYTIGQPIGQRPFELAASVMRKRRAIHWLGDDIEIVRGNKDLLRKLRSGRFIHLAQNDQVARGLRELGLQACVVPLAALSPAPQVKALPETFTLLLYLPVGQSRPYGRHEYERLMQALAGEPVQYLIVGGGRINVPSGVTAQKFKWSHSLNDLYDRSTALVRFTQQNSASVMVIEALLHGRFVLSSTDTPHVIGVRSFEDLEREVRALLKQDSEHKLTPQFDARAAMAALYSPDRCLNMLAEACGWGSGTSSAVSAVVQA